MSREIDAKDIVEDYWYSMTGCPVRFDKVGPLDQRWYTTFFSGNLGDLIQVCKEMEVEVEDITFNSTIDGCEMELQFHESWTEIVERLGLAEE